MDEFKFTLNNPLTEEEWDMITDVDFDHTNKIWFHTKHGKEVVFVKQKKGKWMFSPDHAEGICTSCNYRIYGRPYQGNYLIVPYNFCPNCGADMRGEKGE